MSGSAFGQRRETPNRFLSWNPLKNGVREKEVEVLR
jgi:hypothetical protein